MWLILSVSMEMYSQIYVPSMSFFSFLLYSYTTNKQFDLMIGIRDKEEASKNGLELLDKVFTLNLWFQILLKSCFGFGNITICFCTDPFICMAPTHRFYSDQLSCLPLTWKMMWLYVLTRQATITRTKWWVQWYSKEARTHPALSVRARMRGGIR